MHIYALEKDGGARPYCVLDYEGGSVLCVLSLSTNFLGAATGTGSTCGRGAESGRGFRTFMGALPGAAGEAGGGGAGEADRLDGAGLGGIAGDGLGAGEGRCAGELFVEDRARRAAGFGGKL